MTWSQMEYFARAVAYHRAEESLVALAIAHNPYVKQSKIERLHRHFKRHMRTAQHGEPGMAIDVREGGSVGMTGEALERSMGQLGRLFGPVKRVVLSREEFAARMKAKQ
jgi:hypothetical protein